MCRHILPMSEPFITSYPYYANLQSVILQSDSALAWVFNNHILLESPKKNDIGMRIDYYSSMLWKSCPWIYYQRISRQLVKKWDTVIDFTADAVGKGFYVYFTIDTFYISAYGGYGRYHTIHDIFVYGFDLEKGVAYAADNFADGIYSKCVIPLEQLRQGYECIGETTGGRLEGEIDWLNGVELISFREKYGYDFDVRLLESDLQDYLSSDNRHRSHWRRSDAFWKENCIYGVGVYDVLLRYVEEFDVQRMDFDMRPFHVLWEHKAIMLRRLAYLQEQHGLQADEILRQCALIEKTCMAIRNLWIKASMTGSRRPVNRLAGYLEDVRRQEIQCFKALLEALAVLPKQ